MTQTATRRRVYSAVSLVLFLSSPALAQLNQNCTVSVLNRTVTVNPDGSWVLPNIPANFGQVKARATCVQNGVTTFGESDFFTVPANGAANLPAITMGATTPIPVSLAIGPSSPSFTTAGQTVQLAVTATYPDGSTKDVTGASTGTNYTISNPAIATISADGLVAAVSSGNVVIQANNDGATGIATVSIVLGGASVGGIPVTWLLQYGLNPADPLIAMEDPDRDGLTNLQEFQQSTNPNNPDTDGDGLSDGDEVNKYKTQPLLADTDGDGIPDGVEVQTGTNPLDASSYDLKKATASSVVTPSSFTLRTGTTNPILSVQLNWKVTLIDGKTTLDLTADQRTRYTSSDLSTCNFGGQPGLVFSAQNTGSCVITITQNTLSVAVPGTVTTFSPTEVSTLSVPGAVAVDVAGNFAYVAVGAKGLAVVDVTDRTKPHLRGTLSGLGNIVGVRAVGQTVFLADSNGALRIVDAQDTDAPLLISSISVPGNPSSLAVHGNLGAIAAQSGGVSLIDISDLNNPKMISTIAGQALGVDFDLQSGLAAIAMGGGGLQLADISNAALPRLRGLLPGGNVQRVLLRLPAALLADSQRSVTAVDVSNPDQPVLSYSLDPSLGGVPVDIAAFGSVAITADITFGRAVPIVNISDPLQPRSLGYWTLLSPGYGSSIAMDLSFGYLIIPATGTLRILKYQDISDTAGMPPTISITSPSAGQTLIQGQPLKVSANATDDVAVASVSFFIDGQQVFTTSAAPYQFNYTVSPFATALTFGATALDYGNNLGVAQNITVQVIPDPLTTVTGRVVGTSGMPSGGASVSAEGKTTTSATDGTFTLSGLPTISGPIVVTAVQTVNGTLLAGVSAGLPPMRGGITVAGDIQLAPRPFITSILPKSILAGVPTTVTVSGSNFGGATFAFASSTPFTLGTPTVNAAGTSATFTVTPDQAASGRYTLVATGPAGSSNSPPGIGFIKGSGAYNSVTIPGSDPNADPDGDSLTNAQEIAAGTDPLNGDTDADGFPDGLELALKSDPLDPASTPTPASFGANGQVFSILNQSAPYYTNPGLLNLGAEFSLLNLSSPIETSPSTSSISANFSVLNQSAPYQTNPGLLTLGAEFSLLNLSSPIETSPSTSSISANFSVLNLSSPVMTSSGTLTVASVFSVLNQSSPPVGTAGYYEVDAIFSVLNGSTTKTTTTKDSVQAPTTAIPEVAPGPTGESFAATAPNLLGTHRILTNWRAIRLSMSSTDSNGNGLPDDFERFICGTATCANPNDDPDHDGLTNAEEWRLGTNPLDPDTDHDGLSDSEEIRRGTDPLTADTDGDGWTDGDEVAAHSDPLNPASVPKLPLSPTGNFIEVIFSIQNDAPGLAELKPPAEKFKESKGESAHEIAHTNRAVNVRPASNLSDVQQRVQRQ